ncbi:MAG TPA: condensation domain-containing protein, partial [Thermoanaerobaculia bacterium]|nr:condensation domain-containing protein [Thermoanaerobaculia bacterium]
VVGAPGADLANLAELPGYLASRLPAYMVPAAIVTLPALPRTGNGKVDRRALPAPELPGDGREGTTPRTPAEEVMARLWAEVLAIEDSRIALADSFFELGGHSLLATRLASRVRQAFGVELPLKAVFEAPTLAGLAALAERTAQAPGAPPPLLPIPAPLRTGPLPLSFAQERLWFLDQLDPGSGAYDVPAALRLRGALAAPVLAASFAEIVRRHEALRTVFAVAAGEPAQVILPATAAAATAGALPEVDLAGLPQGIRDGEARRLASAEARRPFDLARGPLLRLTLVRLAADEHLTVLNLHHIVTDGWSMGVLVQELGALYRAFLAGRPSPLPELPLQYADFAVWQRRWLSGEMLAREVDYWREALAGLAPLDLPADRPRPPQRSGRGALCAFTLSRDLAAALSGLARSAGGTLFMTLLAGLSALLARATGQADLAVGSPVANRTHREVEKLIGFFVNTLVLRADLAGDPAFREILAGARRTALAAYAHQHLPFEKVVESVSPERDASRTPLFQVMLALQNAPREALDLPQLRLEPVEIRWDTAKFDLTLTVTESPQGLAGAWEYSRDLFDRTTVERLSGHLETLLAAAAGRPELRLAELPLFGEAGQHQVLTAWNDTAAAFSGISNGVPVHRLVERQAAGRPNAPAVTGADGRRLSYGDLDRQADRLAHRLRALGVGPEVRVGVCLPRAPEMVTAYLAIWKAGGAYLPLDPGQPRERLAYMLEDSGARVVVTERPLALELGLPAGRCLCLDEQAEGVALP